MEEVIESFRDGFIPHQFEYSGGQSQSSSNNVLLLIGLITVVAAGYAYYLVIRERDYEDPPRKPL
jgi:hypothetical protein